MFGGSGRRSVGKKIIETDDGRSLICDIDEYGNIIPGSCEELIEKTDGKSKTMSFPDVPLYPKNRR